MIPAARDHVLAATHFVLGPSNFLVLRLPGNWDVRIGRNPSDIDYTIAVDGVRWAQAGHATAFLLDEKAHRAMEFDLRTSRGPLKQPALHHPEAAQFQVAGHPAQALLGGTRLGMFRNKAYEVLHITYRCEETQRNLALSFLARTDPAELKALLPTLTGSRCH